VVLTKILKNILNTKIPHSIDYNPYLDGLRGLSVILVVLFHFFPDIFSFGFVGVDIFFLLSGYLITTIIINKIEKKTFSFKEFYRNRARRLFPALIVVLVFALILGFFFLYPSEYKDLAKHIKSSALYYENFRLINEISYWDKDAFLKPLLHIWSLSVEEQFYLFWPITLIIIYISRLKKFLFEMILFLFILTFIISLTLTFNNPEVAFFHTLSRTWELLYGALLAVVVKKYNSITYVQNLKKYIPLIFVISIIILLYKQSMYNPVKIFIILSITFVWIFILVRERKDSILGNKILIFFGLISYSLYLWHYLILGFLHIFGYTNIFFLLLGLFISFIFSILTFKFIEVPFRKRKDYKTAIILLLTLIIIALISQQIYVKQGLSNRLGILLKNEKFILEKFQFGQRFDKNCTDILKALGLDAKLFGYCRANTTDISNIKVVILGDSHSIAIYEGLEDKLSNENIGVLLLGRDGCLPYINTGTGSFSNKKSVLECLDKNEETYKVFDKIKNLKVVILASRIAYYYTGYGYGDSEKKESKIVFSEYFYNNPTYNQKAIFLKHLQETFSYFQKKKIYTFLIIENPELGFSPKVCLKRFILPNPREKSCYLPKEEYVKRRKIYLDEIKRLVKEYKYAYIIDSKDVFCKNDLCIIYENKIPLYYDDDHLTIYGGKKLVNHFFEELLKVIDK